MNRVCSLNYRVRRGLPVDAKAVLALFVDTLREYGFVVTKRNVGPDISTFGSATSGSRLDLVVVRGSEVCGFLILTEPSQGCGEITKVFVDSRHRRRGLGTRLIDASVDEGKKRGYREIMLETDTAFREARRYYEQHGWTLMPHLEESATRTYVKRLIGVPRSLVPIPEVSEVRIRVSTHRPPGDSLAETGLPRTRRA